MSRSYCETVDLVIDAIALRGSRGLQLAFFLETVTVKLMVHIARNALICRSFKFQINGQDCAREDITEETIRNSICFAPLHESLNAFGLSPFEVLPPTSLAILELVGSTGLNGCLITDVAQVLNIPIKGIHDFVDRLSLSGHIVKRLVCPQNGSLRQRVAVMHLKRFAADYNPIEHGLHFIDYSVYTQIADIIFELLETHNITSIPARVVAKHIGLTKKQMYNVRNYVVSNCKRIDLKIKFTCDGLLWSISRSEDESGGSDKAAQPFTSLRNLALYETVAAVLRESTVGVDVPMISRAVGINTKSASKISAVFASELQYPQVKTQVGKQIKYVLYGKNRPPPSFSSGAADAMDLTQGAECDIIRADPTAAASVATTSTPANASGSKSATPSSTAKRGGGLTEQQKTYERMALAYLNQFGGIVTEAELVKHIRTVQTEGTIDKKTFNRLMDRLTAEKILVVMDLVLPRLRRKKDIGDPGTENIAVVILLSFCGENQQEGGDDDDDDDGDDRQMERMVALRDQLIIRRHAEFFKTEDTVVDDVVDSVVPTPKKRTPQKRKISNVEGTDDHEASSAVVANSEIAVGDEAAPKPVEEPARKVREYNLVVFELPKAVKDMQHLLSHYCPAGLLVAAMNLHLFAFTAVPVENEKISLPPVDTLLGMLPVRFFLVSCKTSLREKFFEDLRSHSEYGDMFHPLPSEAVTLGEVLALEESLDIDHFRRQIPLFRQLVLLSLLLLLSVGIVRCEEDGVLNDVFDCLKSFAGQAEVVSIVSQVTQRQFYVTSKRVNEDSDLRLSLLSALLISQYQEAPAESEVVASLLEILSGCSFSLSDKPTTIHYGKRGVYRVWRSLLVHCLHLTSLNDVNTLLQETDVVFRYEVEDKVAGVARPCPYPTQKAVDEIAAIWSSNSESPISIPLEWLILGRVIKKAPKRQRVSAASSASSLEPMDVPDDVTDVTKEVTVTAEDIGEPQTSASPDDIWTREQDTLLLRSFLHRFLFKKTTQGLPFYLLDFTLQDQSFNCKLVAGEKFSIDPKQSCLAVHLPSLDFSHVHEYLVTRGVSGIKPHTLSAARKRLPLLLQATPRLRSVCAGLLCQDREYDPDLVEVFNVIHPPSLPHNMPLSSSSSVSLLRRETDNVLALVFQMLYEDRLDRQQLCIDKLRTSFPPEAVAQVCRELFLWGWMRKTKDAEEEKIRIHGYARTELLDNLFLVQLAPFFLRTGFSLTESEEEEGGLGRHSSRYDGMQPLDRKGMIQAHESLSLIYALINGTTATSITVRPDPEATVYNQQNTWSYSDKTSSSSSAGSSSSSSAAAVSSRMIDFESRGFCCTHLNRLVMTISAKPAVTRTESAPAFAVVEQNGCIVPWKSAEGASLPHLYQQFAAKLLALLADKPGSNVTQVGAALPMLGEKQLQCLLNELIGQKAIYYKTVSMSIKKKGPFKKATSNAEEQRLYFVSC